MSRKLFSYHEVQFKMFCSPVKTGYPPAKNVNETALYEDHFFLKPVHISEIYTAKEEKSVFFLRLSYLTSHKVFLCLCFCKSLRLEQSLRCKLPTQVVDSLLKEFFIYARALSDFCLIQRDADLCLKLLRINFKTEHLLCVSYLHKPSA